MGKKQWFCDHTDCNYKFRKIVKDLDRTTVYEEMNTHEHQKKDDDIETINAKFIKLKVSQNMNLKPKEIYKAITN